MEYSEVWAEYAQFAIVQAGDQAEPTWFSNGLVTPVLSGLARVHTGVQMGPVLVRVEALSAAPPQLDQEFRWDEVVEVGGRVARNSPLLVVGFELYGPVLKGLALTPGPVRLRVHCLGRDENYDLSVEEASERYLIQLWAASGSDPEGEVVFRQTDKAGQEMRIAFAQNG